MEQPQISLMVRYQQLEHIAKLQCSKTTDAKVAIFVVMLLPFIETIRTTRSQSRLPQVTGLLMP